MSDRVSKIDYYLDIAQVVAGRSTCLRRKFGAVIVKDDVVISTGYNGAPRGRTNCTTLGYCLREKLGVPHGKGYEICRAVHAEANAIIAAPHTLMMGATLYQSCINANTGRLEGNVDSCAMCKRLIINAGMETVIHRTSETEHRVVKVQALVEDDDRGM